MKRRVFLIHGFNVKDNGAGTIDKWRPLFEAEGYDVIDFDYGYLELFGVRFKTNSIAKKFASLLKEDDIVVAHSHGCAITAKVLESNTKIYKAIFVHPALQSDWKIPTNSVDNITVFYSNKDMATWGARLLRRFSPLNLVLGQHFWGAMGSTGATSGQLKFKNINDGLTHSSIFTNKHTKFFKSIILQAIK